MNRDKISFIVLVILLFWMVGSLWQLQTNPLKWFTKVEPGQIWLWDTTNGDPFSNEEIDTIWIKAVQGNYVRCNSKPWYGGGRVITITYNKQLFNHSDLIRIK